MRFAVSILAISVILFLLGLKQRDEILLVAAALALGGLYLLERGWHRRRQGQGTAILLDGSNIMYWRDGVPRLDTVREVVDQLAAQGYRPGVVFDASAGHRLEGRYLHHPTLARALNLPPEQVMVVNKGEVADALLLRAGCDMSARIVTNDRYRDWAGQFPKVAEPGYLIGGRYRHGALELDLA